MSYLRPAIIALLALAALVVAALPSRHIGSDASEVPAGAWPGSAAAQVCSVLRTAGGSDTGGGSALMVPVSLDKMTDESARIVVGRVQSLRSCLSKDGRSIITQVVLATERHLKTPDGPPAPGTKVTILVPGGRFGDFRLNVGTSPEFSVRERVVVFLRQVQGEGLRLTEGFQSKLSVNPGDLVERANLSLAEFEAKVRQAIDGTLAPQGDPLFQPGLVVVEQPFVASGPIWPPSSIPVNYFIDPTTNRPSQLTANQSRQAVINGFNTWESVPGSSIAFNFVSDFSFLAADGCSSLFPPDFFNDITWGIADPAHGAGLLAITISCFNTAPDPDEVVDADIEFDTDHFGATWRVDGSGACGSGLFDLETVMLHEEGHFLGLGHPTFNACVDGACPVMNALDSGVRRTLCADDINGVTALYPTTPTFGDVPSDHLFRSYIEALFDAGITTGCATDPLLYCPNNPVTRAQMAAFLLRAMGHADHLPSYQGYFSDVPSGLWYTGFVEHLFQHGVTGGCATDPLRYCPNDSVSRAEMAVFLLRGIAHADHLPAYQGYFDDVAAGLWFTAFVEHLSEHGITAGCSVSPPLYCPFSAVTRAQMAAFIVRAFELLPP